MKLLWEILVPTVRKDGKPYRTRYHRVWDEKVREISHGLTVLTPSKGQWIAPSGELIAERVIPVRFMASRNQAGQIVDFTLQYYDQEAVMCYLISSEVIIATAKRCAEDACKLQAAPFSDFCPTHTAQR